jgi:DNA primase
VRLQRHGREHVGRCPFHREKTPSFHVYPDHFHCYGCGAHGDAIGWTMQAEGIDR